MSGSLAIFGLPNPTAKQLLIVLAVLFVVGAVVAYRRPVFDRVSLLVQTVVFVLAELAIYAYYINFRQPFHWANHLLPAVVLASAIYGVWLLVKKRPLRGQILLLVPLHLIAMAPDPLFSLNVRPHEEWMNVFVGHIWAHFLPFRLNGWLVLAVVASGLYVFTLARWLGRQGGRTATTTTTG